MGKTQKNIIGETSAATARILRRGRECATGFAMRFARSISREKSPSRKSVRLVPGRSLAAVLLLLGVFLSSVAWAQTPGPPISSETPIIYAGEQGTLHGGETLRLVLLFHLIGPSVYDEIDFSWNVTGGGSIEAVPGRTTNDRIVVYRAPAQVSSRFIAIVTCTITLRGDGTTARDGTSTTPTAAAPLAVLPNPSGGLSDLRGPTSERNDTYSDGYVFWNGGQGMQFTHTPWINAAPGRTVTYSFPKANFTRHGKTLKPLVGDPPPGNERRRRYSTEGLRGQFRQAFAQWEQYLNIHFEEVENDATANLVIGKDESIARHDAYAETKGDMNSMLIGVSRSFTDQGQSIVTETSLRMVGHALGLGLPHNQGGGGDLDDAIMESSAHREDKTAGGDPRTLSFSADIIGAQHLWGKAAGAPRTPPDVPATATLTYDSANHDLATTWTGVQINGGEPTSGWIVEWFLDSDPSATGTSLGGGMRQRTDNITDPATRSATFPSPANGDWSVQIRAKNKVGEGLRKRAPAAGSHMTVSGPTPGVKASPSTATLTELGRPEGIYDVVLKTKPGGSVTVTPTSSDPGAVTIATSGPLSFDSSNWNQAQMVTVEAVNDDAQNESVKITHAVSGYGAVASGPNVTVTVRDIAPPEAFFAPSSQITGEGSGKRNVEIKLTKAVSAPVTINYAVSGTATDGVDFRIANPGPAKIARGDSTTAILVEIIDDKEEENSETVVLTLKDGDGYLVAANLMEHTLNITDNDSNVQTAAESGGIDGEEIPETFALEQNYPNPFNPSTTIEFSLDETQRITLVVYDMLGHEVRVLLDGVQPAARYSVPFDASDIASGTYLYVLRTEKQRAAKTMTLLK